MGDYAIQMQFDIAADDPTLRRALTTTDGIRAWWSTKSVLSDGHLDVSFPDVPRPFEFTAHEDPGGAIEWVTGGFPPWWAGTTVSWALAPNPDGPGTRLLFRHGGYDADNPVIPIVTPAWTQIVLRLKGYAESGTPDPFFLF